MATESPLSIPPPGWGTVFSWMMRRVVRYRVAGRSMAPMLSPGDTLWIDRWAYRRQGPAVGDVVVANHPFRKGQRLVKRVSRVLDSGHLELLGDSPDASTDSRGLGAFSPELVVGRVIARNEG